MVFARYALVLIGLVLCGLGVAQVPQGVPGLSPPPAGPVPAHDAFLALGGLAGGLVCGLVALALAGPAPPPIRAPAGGKGRAGQFRPSRAANAGAISAEASSEVICACRNGRSMTSSPAA